MLNKTIYKVTLIHNAKSIEIICAQNTSNFAAFCYDGTKYLTFIINISMPSVRNAIVNFNTKKIKEDHIPIKMLFDENLVPVLYCKNFNGSGVDAFTYDKKGILDNSNSIDSIKNIEYEKYISVSGNYCYKIAKFKNEAQLVTIDSRSGSRVIKSIPNAFSINDYQVNLDSDGKPLFLTVDKGHRINIPLKDSAKSCIESINNKFQRSDWRMIDSTKDGNTLLLCTYNPQKSNTYYLFDKTTNKCAEIAVSNGNVSNIPLEYTDSVIIPMKTYNGKTKGYLTRISTSNLAPLIIFGGVENGY